MPTFPPTAHRANPKCVSEQPMAASGMIIAPSNGQPGKQTQSEERHSPARLRGGCFPLPVSAKGIYYCQITEIFSTREEDVATLSLFLAAAKLRLHGLVSMFIIDVNGPS